MLYGVVTEGKVGRLRLHLVLLSTNINGDAITLKIVLYCQSENCSESGSTVVLTLL